MDMKLSGSGVVTPGEYDAVAVSGSCKIEGPVRCETLRCSGSVHGQGQIVCTGEAQFSGSAHLDGTLEAETIDASGSFSGAALRARGEVRISGAARLSGGISAGTVSIHGGAKLEGDIEGERVRIAGTVQTPGLVNGETVELSATGSELGAVGGSKITVRRSETAALRRFSLFRRNKVRFFTLTVRDGIEGDEIVLEDTVCPRVSGKRVVIGPGCRIGEVCYGEDCTVDPGAEVGKLIKI